MTETTVLRRCTRLAVVEHETRCTLLPLARLEVAEPIVLEHTALSVWRAIDGVRDADDVVAEVADRYGTAPEAVRDDVLAFVAQLCERGLVESATPSG